MLLFSLFFSEYIQLSRRVPLMKQKECLTFGNFNFSGKEVFCKIYSCSVNLLGKYATNFIEKEP